MKPITQFRSPYDFLSNFYFCPIEFEGYEYPTVEHAYQAAKTLKNNERTLIRLARSPGVAKRLGKEKLTLREDWEDIKLKIMYQLLHAKFSNPELRQRLLDTGNVELVEGNSWGDTYWGVCNGRGVNMLGKLLMRLRHTLSNE